jgi:hypothetical protein
MGAVLYHPLHPPRDDDHDDHDACLISGENNQGPFEVVPAMPCTRASQR